MTDQSTLEAMPDAREASRYSISDLSSEFGITARALRFYEDEGLIAPERVGLSRVYSRRDRARLTWILRAKRVGFSLAEIREMIDLHDSGDDRRAHRQITIAKCRERIETLLRQRGEIDGAVTELEAFVVSLRDADRKGAAG